MLKRNENGETVGRIAAVGDRDSVLAFKAVGLDVFPVSDPEEAEAVLKREAGKYAVIFVTEQIAMNLEAFLARYKTKPYPAIIPVPSGEGSNGFGMDGVRKDVERAVGADILFKSGEDKI